MFVMKKIIIDCSFLSAIKAFLFISMTDIIMILDFKIRDSDVFMDMCGVTIFITVAINFLMLIILYKRHQNITHIFVIDLIGFFISIVFTVLYLVIINLIDFNVISFFVSNEMEESSAAGLMLIICWIMYFVAIIVSKIVLYIIFGVVESKKNKRQQIVSHTPPFKANDETD